uniref:hypothetical protein n=1 Tax=Salmonella sp. s58408 TaxID=3159701 RepID=UPI00397F8BE9
DAAVVTAPTPTENATAVEPVAVADDSTESAAVGDEPAVLDAAVVSVETVEPAAVDVIETASARDIDNEVAEDAGCVNETSAVAASKPAEDAASIEAAVVVEDATETTAVE